MRIRSKLLIFFSISAACSALWMESPASAGDAKVGPAGTWTWTTPGRNGGPDRTSTLTLEFENSKLTGKLAAPGRAGQVSETPISEGKVDGDTISFAIVREFNGNSVTNKYSGKIDGDIIHGKLQFTRNGEERSREWQATRSTAAK